MTLDSVLRHTRRAIASLLCVAVLLVTVGCPHRSPTWSPNGQRILVLAGEKGEDVDKAASQLWIVDVTDKAKPRRSRIAVPEPGCRFLSATWLADDDDIFALTGTWDEDSVVPGSEKVWRHRGGKWQALAFPTPNEARGTRRLPVVVTTSTGRAVAYPVRDEAVALVSLASGETIAEYEPAELIGPGPAGGLLLYRPEKNSDTGGFEIVSLDAQLEERWRQSFADLRSSIAQRLGRKPVEVIFNEASTSHLPRTGKSGAAADWVGVTMIFSDVGWKDGIRSYYVQLDAKSGALKTVAQGTGVAGKPEVRGGDVWAALAKDSLTKKPTRLVRIALETRKVIEELAVGAGNDAVHGYAVSPQGDAFVVSINDSPPRLEFFADSLAKPVRVPLVTTDE